MPAALFISLELLFLAIAQAVGGPAWTGLGVIACIALAFAGMQPGRLAVLYPSLAWLAASRLTGNRELFFPYAMVLATAVAVLLPRHRFHTAAIGGGVLVAAFLAIRIHQGAGGRVLAVESVVAVAILGIALATRSWTAERVLARAWIPLAASLLAFACLAL